MKQIPLKELVDGQGPPIVYADVLREVVRQPLDRQRGVSIVEMRQSIRVLDALEAANGTLQLEDADYLHLKAKLEGMQWTLVDRRLLQLIEDVLGAESQ
jgi:uncharacterized Fe-S cluster-containing radical SAM superfamily enzyme